MPPKHQDHWRRCAWRDLAHGVQHRGYQLLDVFEKTLVSARVTCEHVRSCFFQGSSRTEKASRLVWFLMGLIRMGSLTSWGCIRLLAALSVILAIRKLYEFLSWISLFIEILYDSVNIFPFFRFPFVWRGWFIPTMTESLSRECARISYVSEYLIWYNNENGQIQRLSFDLDTPNRIGFRMFLWLIVSIMCWDHCIMVIFFRWLEAWGGSEDYRTGGKRNAYARRSECYCYYGKFLLWSEFTTWFNPLAPHREYMWQCSIIGLAACNRHWNCSFPWFLMENVLREAWRLQGNVPKLTQDCDRLKFFFFNRLLLNYV